MDTKIVISDSEQVFGDDTDYSDLSGSSLSPEVLLSLKSTCDAIVAMFGENCEVIIHDFSDIEHSIVYIAGNVTDRKIGGSITDLGLSVITSTITQTEPLAYFARSPRGHKLKCVSILIRDEHSDKIQGALCINLDIDNLVGATTVLDNLVGFKNPAPVEERFDSNPEEIVVQKTHETISEMRLSVSDLNGEERLKIVQTLNERGIFAFKSAHSIVADVIGVSRATIYNYLKRSSSAQ